MNEAYLKKTYQPQLEMYKPTVSPIIELHIQCGLYCPQSAEWLPL